MSMQNLCLNRICDSGENDIALYSIQILRHNQVVIIIKRQHVYYINSINSCISKKISFVYPFLSVWIYFYLFYMDVFIFLFVSFSLEINCHMQGSINSLQTTGPNLPEFQEMCVMPSHYPLDHMEPQSTNCQAVFFYSVYQTEYLLVQSPAS